MTSDWLPLLKGLYLILDPTVCPDRSLVDILHEAADNGARLFQYRDKSASMREAYQQATALRRAAAERRALFLVNDRCDLALAVDADGVHLGQNDLPLSYARSLLGDGKLIGMSTHQPAQVKEAAAGGADYLGYGPIYSTATKPDHEAVVGVQGLQAIRPLTRLPVFAIGGITEKSAKEVVAAGADGVSVISAVLKAPHVGQAVRTFIANFS
ncbi:MAG: thiamine phosphate synthase [Nitrospiraceae bacterium]